MATLNKPPVGHPRGLATASPKTIAALAIMAAAVLVVVVYPGGTLLDHLFLLNGGVCAQRPAHSYFLGGQQLPVEARMVGIFGGFALTVLYVGWFLGRSRAIYFPHRALTIVLALGVVAVGFDGLNATAYDLGLPTLYQPQNILRLVTGLLSGVGFGVLLLPLMNLCVWQSGQPVRAVMGWAEYIGGLVLVAILALLTISGWGWLLYPIALLSAAGAALLLTTLNIITWGVIMRWDRTNMARRWRELLLPVSLLFAFSIAELLLFGWARYTFLPALPV